MEVLIGGGGFTLVGSKQLHSVSIYTLRRNEEDGSKLNQKLSMPPSTSPEKQECGAENSMESGAEVNSGLPPLDLTERPVSFFEFWPAWVFYIPVFFYWLWLALRYKSFGLPMLANPDIELGGMVGESKSAILNLAGARAFQKILPFVTAVRGTGDVMPEVEPVLLKGARVGITFPLVVKPDLGCRGSGVRVVESKSELVGYLNRFPRGRTYILQKLAPFSAEAGVFYERYPNQARGKITSLTLKYVPWVTGDGYACLGELIDRDERAGLLGKIYKQRNKYRLTWVPNVDEKVALAFAGSHCRGAIFRNGMEYITDDMENALDSVLTDVQGFYYGRLDIKFSSLEQFQRGKEFAIIEINGASSEATHIWDSRTKFWEVYRVLFRQYRVLFEMGNELRNSGYAVPSATTLIKTWWKELEFSGEYPKSN